MDPIKSEVYFDLGAGWVKNLDVLQKPPLTWEYGLRGDGPTDLLASTGIATFYLDNSHSNGAGTPGLYSPDHTDLLAGFGEGTKCKIQLPGITWLQRFYDSIGAFDSITPGWDGQAFMEGNDMSEFDGVEDVDGDLNPSAASARYGSYGMELAFDDANIAHAWLNLVAIDQTSICIKFDFNPHDVTLAVGKAIDVCRIRSGTAISGLLVLKNIAGQLHFTFNSRHDGADYDAICTPSILSDWNEIVLYIKAATGDGANDGIARMYLNSDLAGSSTTLDNDTIDFDFVSFGMNSTTELGFGGSYYFDNMMIDTIGSPYESIDGAHNGLNGLAFHVMEGTSRYVAFTDPAGETVFASEFWIDPNTLTMADNDYFLIHLAWGANVGGTTSVYIVDLIYQTMGGYSLCPRYYTDAGALTPMTPLPGIVYITDEPHHCRVEWKAASAPAANDGVMRFYVDGVLELEDIVCDTDQRDIDNVDFGALSGLDAGTYGIFYLDDIKWGNTLTQVKFHGRIADIRPDPGLFDDPAVEVEVHDWIGYLPGQELGLQAVDSTVRANEALTTVLTDFPIQPEATDFDTGVETFLVMFHTDSPETSMASFFSKMCRNELGRVYLQGDGTLRFEHRNIRAGIVDSDFTLDGEMTNLGVAYKRRDIYNVIQARIEVMEATPAANVLLWDLKVAEYFGGVIPSIAAGETLVILCPFTHPALGGGISAMNVVDPIVTVEFGSVADYESNDMIGDLGITQVIGGYETEVTMTNNHGANTGYLNDLQVYGRAIISYGNRVLKARDQTSIDSGTGERRFRLRLEHIIDDNTAQAYVDHVLSQVKASHLAPIRVKVLANQGAMRNELIMAEVSSRFSLTESVTGIDEDFFVNNLKYIQDGQQLWVVIEAGPATRYAGVLA